MQVKHAWLLAACLAAPAAADSVSCHIIYGGENFPVLARPTDDPYSVKGQKIGRYFEFKVAYVTSPADLSAISVYVYATSSGESVLVHQAKYPVAIKNAAAWGFTGFNYVYEPSKSSELQYWCEKSD
ncbi:MAG TPA: hypothetical protein VGO61_15380 [Steroidobacteraceae bacterium]|jgi:hypothetical protein|nr:hypothetical protein [Steroidobacteraceae bacterium]